MGTLISWGGSIEKTAIFRIKVCGVKKTRGPGSRVVTQRPVRAQISIRKEEPTRRKPQAKGRGPRRIKSLNLEASTRLSPLLPRGGFESFSSTRRRPPPASGVVEALQEMAAADVVNYPLVAALLAFAVAQFSKFFTTWYKENHWDARQLIAPGGMPSSHSATVTALAVAVGIQEGFRSATFATAVIFAFVVMHDAFGVRLHAGKQAEVLNQIVYGLPMDHPLSETKPLREILGHTVPQVVAGCVLGILMAVVMRLALGSS